MQFQATPNQTTEINGITAKIDGYFIAEDNSVSIPCLHTMSDFRWVILCLIDRLFHPKRYTADGENVSEAIESLTAQLVNMTPEEMKMPLITELEALQQYVNDLPEEAKPEAEKHIIKATRGNIPKNEKEAAKL